MLKGSLCINTHIIYTHRYPQKNHTLNSKYRNTVYFTAISKWALHYFFNHNVQQTFKIKLTTQFQHNHTLGNWTCSLICKISHNPSRILVSSSVPATQNDWIRLCNRKMGNYLSKLLASKWHLAHKSCIKGFWFGLFSNRVWETTARFFMHIRGSKVDTPAQQYYSCFLYDKPRDKPFPWLISKETN